ncbi:MAG: carbon-nitrogen hydrolase family protein [Planctomycetes bacterium]|nr:carbon-nitrogen hydrolase family protein [Planctomycetota bacterium]
MKTNLNRYRLAGVAGGLLLAAGQFLGYLSVLQLIALLPLMVFALRDKRPRWAALAGLYMGIAYTIPQMIYLRMPIPVTVILLVWMTIQLMLLCMAIAYFLPVHTILGPLAVGAVWYILDWINYTAVPVWGMAQTFARGWTAYPFAIQFISITSISGVLFVVGVLQGFAAYIIVRRSKFYPLWLANPSLLQTPPALQPPPLGRGGAICPCWQGESLWAGVTGGAILLILAGVNAAIWFQKPADSIKVAAAGWVFDDRSEGLNPNKTAGFEELFAAPAREAAAEGGRIFTTGEMGFYIAGHEWDERIEQFAQVARENDLWLVVGYFNISIDENRIFFMSPEGRVVHEYTKTHLTPFEPGHKGNGDLKTIEVDGLTIGAMICQDDNFSERTRYYGNFKADIVLCPAQDWRTVKNAHLQAVRARAIECNYPIVRGAACGITAAISARGEVFSQVDHYASGPGYIIEDIPVYGSRTFFSRFGHWPSLAVAGVCIGLFLLRQDAGVGCTR